MNFLKKLSAALCLLACLTALGTAHAGKKTFTFTAIPDQDETRLKERFGKVVDYLETQLGVNVKYIPVKSYAAAVTAFRNNEVQLAWFGGLSGVKARELVPGAQAIAQGYEDPNFTTYFIANASTGLEYSEDFPKEIAGKTFTFGSKGSTSGRLMPEYFIRQHLGQSPEDVFSKVGFSGNHSKTVELVQAGAYDVGATNFKVWKKELAKGLIDESKIKIIWKTPGYPDYQWTINPDVNNKFGKDFVQKVQQALLNMKDPELLEAFPRKSFIKATNDLYQPIKDTAKELGLID